MKTRKVKIIFFADPPVRATIVYGDGLMNRLTSRMSFGATTIGRYIFAEAGCDKLSDKLVNHEMIHVAQQQELWWVGQWALYAWYRVAIWLAYKSGRRRRERPEITAWREAYYNIPFEKEAYANESNLKYLYGGYRNKNAWRKYA
jgi:hypothetical protein